jgi:hypothetical protein
MIYAKYRANSGEGLVGFEVLTVVIRDVASCSLVEEECTASHVQG